MIGDYVIRKNVPKEILIVDTIDSIRDIVYLDLDGLGITEKIENIEPIPLTAEILDKIGFKESKYGEMILDEEEELGTSEIYLVLEPNYDNAYYWWTLNSELIAKIKSVNELQHVLNLCGFNKKIVI